MTDAALDYNLQIVFDYIATRDELNAARRTALQGAIRRVGKWIDLPLERIPSDRKVLRKTVEGLNHSQIGITKKTLANTVSLLNAALDLHGKRADKARTMLSPEWTAALDLIETEWLRFKVLQFARYCDANDIKPCDVNEATFDAWQLWREEYASLTKDPSRAVQDGRKAWNKACALTGFPGSPIKIPSKRKSRLVPLDQLPTSLATELEAYRLYLTQARNQPGGLRGLTRPDTKLNERARSKPVSERVATERVNAIRMAATSLIETGEEAPEDLTSISDIVSADSAALTAELIISRTGNVSEYPHTIVKHLRSVAADWLTCDDAERDAFNTVLRWLSDQAGLGGLTQRNRARLLPFSNPENVARLISLPAQIMHGLEQDRRKTGKVTHLMACRARTAVAISVLTCLPIRRANLVAIKLGQHLTAPASKTAPMHLQFAPHEVKSQRAIGAPVRASVRDVIELYLKHYRPVLIGNADAGYLLTVDGGHAPVTGSNLANAVSALIRDEIGLSVNIHLFRHLMAAIILRQNPGQYEAVRALLGHSKDSRVTELYAEIETEIAAQVLDEAITASAQSARSPRRVTRRWKR